MSMPLDFVQLEFFTYGYMGSIFTYSLWTAPGIAFYLWFSLVYLAIHREDPTDLQFDFHSWPVMSLISGMWAGFFLAWSLKLDILVDTAMKNYRNKKRYLTPEYSFVAIGALVATLGYYYWNGDFSDGLGTVSESVALGVGITLFVLGWIFAIAFIIWGCVSKGDRFNKVMNIKYTIALAVGITVAPALYDYPHNVGFVPWHGLLALAGIIVYWALLYLYIGWLVGDSTDEMRGIRGVRKFFRGRSPFENSEDIDRFTSKRQAQLFVGFGFLGQFLVYLVGWLVDIYTDEEPEPVVIAIAATSFALSILFCALSRWFRVGSDSSRYDKPSSESDSKPNLLSHISKQKIGDHQHSGYHYNHYDWDGVDIVLGSLCFLFFIGITVAVIVAIVHNPTPTPV